MDNKIFVTRPFLPPIDEYISYLQEIWSNEILTNNGPMLKKFEESLKAKLNVKNLISIANATLGLEIAINSLDIQGEIITTPFTFIATSTSIRRQNCIPVFVDINPETLNIDPKRIEESITEKTKAILPVHVFSNPCDIEAIDNLAQKYNLKVVYDAAHALFIKYKGESILNYGDISVLSFHATKLFNTVEGGACITNNTEISNKIRNMKSFGISFDDKSSFVGTNAKMSELHAAMGLSILKYSNTIIANRRKKYELYKSLLEKRDNIVFQKIDPEAYNYSYMPIIVESENILEAIVKNLNDNDIYPRRYFHPSLNQIKGLGKTYSTVKASQDIASRILCLPLYNSLSSIEIEKICDLVDKAYS